MRALHLYSGNLYGGVEAMLGVLARERAAAAGMEPAFALAFPGRLADELRAAGAPLTLLGGARLSRPWTGWAARRRVAALLERERPRVAVFHSAWSHGIFAPAARRAGVPVVFWLHDAVSGGAAERLARRTPPALALCTSRWAKESLPRLFPGARGEVLHPPVAPPPTPAAGTREAVRRELDTADDSTVVLQASRLEPWKGQSLLLQALALRKDDPSWTAWFAGGARRAHERRYADYLRTQAAGLGIAGRVRWVGERSDIPALLAAADLLCQPSLNPEPFGITFVEAMYAGLPVLGAASGGALEVVDAASGRLVPPGEPRALAEALGELFADPELRARLGAAGPKRAARLCHPAVILPRLQGLLAEVAG